MKKNSINIVLAKKDVIIGKKKSWYNWCDFRNSK
jgi:hypothetical protein